MFQHENYDISEMREHVCTKFCPFVYETTAHKFAAALCCIYLIHAKLTATHTSKNQFLQLCRLYKRLIVLLK